MAETAANLTEFVLPETPLRQWVLTVPFQLRAAKFVPGEVLGSVGC